MENHRFTVSGGRAALAALLLFAGGRTAGGGEVAYAGAERVHVEFRAVDESADLGAIFGAGRPLPEGDSCDFATHDRASSRMES